MAQRAPALTGILLLATDLPGAVFLVLLVNERVSHAGDVIADDARQGFVRGFFAVSAGKVVGLFHPVGEEFSDDALGVFFFSFQSGAEIEIFVEEVFKLPTLFGDGRAKGGQALGMAAD